MREISFRGKSIVNGEWLYGSLINNAFFRSNDGTPIPYIMDTDKMEYDDFISVGEQLDDFQVENKSVGQYAGLKDKNGKEIYEGDSFTAKHRSGREYKGYIQKGLSFEFVIKNYSEDFIDGEGFKETDFTFDINSFVQYFPVDDFEVIGNIYENPKYKSIRCNDCEIEEGAKTSKSDNCPYCEGENTTVNYW